MNSIINSALILVSLRRCRR